MTNADSINTAQLSPYDVNRWFPSGYYRGPNIIVWIALSACFISVFIKIWTPTSINRWPEAISTLLFLYPLIQYWSFFKKQPLIILMIAAIIAPIIFYWFNLYLNPELAKKYVLLEPLPRIFLFIPIAWWLGGNIRTIYIFLGIALAGLLYACWLDPNFYHTLQQLFQGSRIDFNILNAQHVALFFSIALVGIISSIMLVVQTKNRTLKIFLLMLITMLSIVCLIALIGTQTRAALLALVICIGYLTVTVIKKIIRTGTFRFTKVNLAKSLLAILIFTTTFAMIYDKFGSSIQSRLTSEKQTVEALLNQDWNNIPYSSLGIRVNTWILALEKINQKPFIGHGANVRLSVIQDSDLPNYIKQSFGHFHNSYIEFTLGYGFLGLFIALTPFIYVLKYCSYADHPLRKYATYGLIVFGTMNIFESYLFFWMGPFVTTMLCAPILSQAFLVQHKNHALGLQKNGK